MSILDDFLSDAEGQELTILELLGFWGYTTRNPAIMMTITARLEAMGLRTEPGLDEGDVTDLVKIVPLGEAAPDGESGSDEEAPVSVTMSVGTLPSAVNGVESVDLDDKLATAETLMLANSYSQVAVLQDGQLRGAVTWESLAAAKARGKEHVRSALDAQVTRLHPNDDLLRHAPHIWTTGFAFVVDSRHAPVGIVTTADLADQFVKLANPFVLISDIERNLRVVIARICTFEEMKAKASYKKNFHSENSLVFGDYVRIFSDPVHWAACRWAIDQQAFINALNGVKAIRNEVMHFKPETLSETDVNKLVSFLKFVGMFSQPLA